MKKLIVFALILGAWSAQGQEIVRKDGEATGVDAEVKDLAITPGYVADLEDWRFGLHGHLLLVSEMNQPDYQGDGLLLLSPQLSVGKRLGATNYFVNGSVGVAQEIVDEVYSAALGTSIRWDAMDLDYILFQRTVGFEFELEGYVGGVNLLMPNLNAYTSAQIGRVVILDITGGVGYCKPATFQEPALVVRLGIGMNIGGGI
jgi:hypothetical protein